ncbi:double-strand break repair protein AddB [Sphingomicrobium sp. XHP0239]|uniref:double-strand break repair protein AddB n=1 Tax=Sphingomicrobium maritimum TaxID=3133972 RepID=UPI0031CC4593
MSEARAGPTVYSIPPHRSFADAFVAGILATDRSPLDLARGRILVPTNRAARTIRDAFVRAAGEGTLLPRLVPIGDPELDERLGSALDPIDATPVPPAIAPTERIFLLSGILARQPGTSTLTALREAADLATALDQLIIEGVSPRELHALASEEKELEAHWALLLAKLDVIFTAWPALLAERGLIDLADRRNRLLDRLSERWKAEPPPGFTIAAGITTTAPAVAGLLGTVARLAEGQVVLPALARVREMPEEEWDALDVDPDSPTGASPATLSHPQYHLKLLLERMKVGRGEVRDWHRQGLAAASSQRSRVILNAMTGARFTDKWESLSPADRTLGDKVRHAVFPTPVTEAMGIAIALREALEEPGRTASLVTPDRGLAARVSAILRRWGVDADDSAGRPLGVTPPGILCQLLLETVEDDFGPISLMALLKHPLVGGERRASGEWLRAVRRLDLALRGPRPGGGLDAIAAQLAERDPRERDRDAQRRERDQAAFALVRPDIERACRTLSEATTVASLAASLRDALDGLTNGQAFAGAAGRELAAMIEELEFGGGGATLAIAPDERLQVWRTLMAGRSVRPPYGGHPRIRILGLLEARLVQSDLMILAGLNEGSWPRTQSSDPWLAPRLRRRLGLPGLDYRIGLAGHDFMSALGAPEVLLTRAERDERSPTIASRFWLRLEAMVGETAWAKRRDTRLERLAHAIDAPATVDPVDRPMPVVPVDKRPDRLSVTSVEKLRADPFAFYAGSILNLRSLDKLDSRSIAAWQGSRVHKWLEEWLREGSDPATLEAGLDRLLARDEIHPMLRALWGGRLRETCKFLRSALEQDRAAGRKPALAEAHGEARIGGVRVHGYADRIDRCPNGGVAIVDYKTGGSPTRKALDQQFALQLGLLGLIAARGGFADAGTDPVALEYWKFAKKGQDFGERMSATKDDIADYLAQTEAMMTRLAEDYLTGNEPFVAKLNPAFAPYGDYDQLMRLEEWYGRA